MSKRRKAEDYYSVLGVGRAASAEEIKAAFKAHAKALHPDKNRQRDTTPDFQRLQEAYAVLEDPKQREHYDLGKLTAEIDPSAPAPEAEIVPVYKRWPGYLFGALVTTAIISGFLFYQSESMPKSSLSGGSNHQPGSAVDLPGLDHETQAAIFKIAQGNSETPQSAPTEVEVAGRDGRRHVISSVVAKQLEPARDKLFSNSAQLRERGSSLQARHEAVERDRRTLDPSRLSAIDHFNKTVEALNRDATDFDQDVKLHTKEIDAFFIELDRVTLRIR